MNNYKCKFEGREKNAIGIFSVFEKTVQANNVEEAHMKLYDTHEHIHKFVICNESNPKDFKSSKRID